MDQKLHIQLMVGGINAHDYLFALYHYARALFKIDNAQKTHVMVDNAQDVTQRLKTSILTCPYGKPAENHDFLNLIMKESCIPKEKDIVDAQIARQFQLIVKSSENKSADHHAMNQWLEIYKKLMTAKKQLMPICSELAADIVTWQNQLDTFDYAALSNDNDDVAFLLKERMQLTAYSTMPKSEQYTYILPHFINRNDIVVNDDQQGNPWYQIIADCFDAYELYCNK